MFRRRLLMALEEAEQTRNPERRRFLQSVVVVGAGPAGCELAGSLIELMHRAVERDFKQLDRAQCRVILLDAVDRVLPAMAANLSADDSPADCCQINHWKSSTKLLISALVLPAANAD